MTAPVKLAVLASGNGSNLQALLDCAGSGAIPAQIAVVVSDKKEAYALERARKAGVEAIHLPAGKYPSREDYDAALAEILKTRGVGWIILAGFMRILSPAFVRSFPDKIINVHPSLLPQYPGTRSIERAHASGEPRVGVTVHFVDEGVDTGRIIAQETIDVLPGETLQALTERVHRVEHRLFPAAVAKAIRGEA